MIAKKFRQVASLVRFRQFERTIHPETWRRHDSISKAAHVLSELRAGIESQDDPDENTRLGLRLAKEATHSFSQKHRRLGARLRILVHLPPLVRSPGGYSLFKNLTEGLRFIGIPTEILGWEESIAERLCEFKPTVFITSDSAQYLGRIDWKSVRRYKAGSPLKVGLTASLAEYGNLPLRARLRWAGANGIDFYYSFKSPEYVAVRAEYGLFRSEGYPLFNVEFGANPLVYQPVPSVRRDLNFVFLASANPDKRPRYYDFLGDIFRRFPGFIDGPGWSRVKSCAPPPIHKYLYAQARAGINLHIENSIRWASELNERTYILAACAVPQLVDNAPLLPQRFRKESLFVAATPKEYVELFEFMIKNPDQSARRARCALEDVYGGHTSFHRAEVFAGQLAARFFPADP